MYLLDTNTIIDFLNSRLPLNANELLFSIEPKISFITRIELFSSSNISVDELKVLNEFVDITFTFDLVDAQIIKKAIEIRQKHKIKLPDAIIAATAISKNIILITRNLKDFQNIIDLQVIDPYNL